MIQSTCHQRELWKNRLALLGIGLLCMPSIAVAECFPAGKTTELHEMSFLEQATLGPDGKYVLVESKHAPTAHIFDLRAGKESTIGKPSETLLKFVDEGDVAFEMGGKWTAVNLVSQRKRALNTAEIATETYSANIAKSLPLTATLPIAAGSHIANVPAFGALSSLEVVTEQQLCAEPDARQFSESEIAAALQKFARPGGFSNATDLEQWLAIARSHKGSPGLISASLLGILIKSPDLFEALAKKLGAQLDWSKLDQKFLTKKEKVIVAEQVQSYLVRTFTASSEIHFETLKRYAPLIRAVSSLKDKNELLDIVGYRAAEEAANLPRFAETTPYAVFAFAYNAAGLLFKSTDAVDFTDLVASQMPGEISFTLYGTKRVDHLQPNIFGFYSKMTKHVKMNSLSQTLKLKWNWTQGAKTYEALIKLQPSPPTQVITPPNTTKEFSTENRHGIVVIDSNLEVDLTKSTLLQYRCYYEQIGYKFASPQPNYDLFGLLAKRLSSRSDTIDYLIKEAHANGEGDTVMKVASRGFVQSGIKPSSGSRTESVEIIYNLERNPTEHLVSNADFSGWLSRRHYSQLHPLVYMNASCWSYVKAALELGWTDTQDILEIPTLGPVNTFEANDESAEKVLLDGIRAGSSFGTIREQLAAQTGYASGSEDRFVFPDEETYAQKVTPYGTRPAQITRQLFTSNGKNSKVKYLPDGY